MGKVYDALRKAESERAQRRSGPTMPAAEDWAPAPRAADQRRKPLFSRIFSGRTPGAREDVSAANKRRLAMLQPDSFAVEQFRTLRARLDALATTRPIRTIAMASALPGEGKSVAAVNLALVSAMGVGRKVVLVDCDMRTPRVHRALGLEPRAGLGEVLAGQAALNEALIRVEGIELDVLAVRALPPNPAELLASSQMEKLVEELAKTYDTVVMDTPPTLSVPDSKSVSELSDGVVLVVRADVTPEEDVQAVLDILDRRRVLGLVLNDVQIESSRYRYYRKSA